jgi:hypothetical protein
MDWELVSICNLASIAEDDASSPFGTLVVFFIGACVILQNIRHHGIGVISC